ncbi:MAG: hypothetical protein IPM57_05060 [Oligoflexia bacterium]|nr:hypothetical protein [Oligoflexia bacterium]
MSEDKKQQAANADAPPPAASESSATKGTTVEDRRHARRAAKEQQRLNLWRSRVHLVKDARDRFSMKDFSGAIVSYEKYFRVLEIIYEAKPNELKVEYFNNSARAKELVIIASAFWDMVRIYDQSPKFSQRLNQCADKLAEFLPYTPIYMELTRKIEEYKKTARNRDVFEMILKKAKRKKGRCFIATAAFDSPLHPTVVTLSAFRDEVLLNTVCGKSFTKVYYFLSPPIARIVEKNPTLKSLAQKTLNFLALKINKKLGLK